MTTEKDLEVRLKAALSEPESPPPELVRSTLEAAGRAPGRRYVNVWAPVLLLSLLVTLLSSILLLALGTVFPTLGIAAIVYFVCMLTLTVFLFCYSVKHQNITQGANIEL